MMATTCIGGSKMTQWFHCWYRFTATSFVCISPSVYLSLVIILNSWSRVLCHMAFQEEVSDWKSNLDDDVEFLSGSLFFFFYFGRIPVHSIWLKSDEIGPYILKFCYNFLNLFIYFSYLTFLSGFFPLHISQEMYCPEYNKRNHSLLTVKSIG